MFTRLRVIGSLWSCPLVRLLLSLSYARSRSLVCWLWLEQFQLQLQYLHSYRSPSDVIFIHHVIICIRDIRCEISTNTQSDHLTVTRITLHDFDNQRRPVSKCNVFKCLTTWIDWQNKRRWISYFILFIYLNFASHAKLCSVVSGYIWMLRIYFIFMVIKFSQTYTHFIYYIYNVDKERQMQPICPYEKKNEKKG